MSDTRRHHYQYAHYWLRGWFQLKPETVLARLGGDDGLDILGRLWDDLGDRLAPEDRMEPEGLGLARRHVEHGTCEDFFAIVEMPAPQAMTECHFVAMVVRSPDGRIVPESRAEVGRTAQSWYFTLEYSFEADFETPTAIVCSWDVDDKHSNFGGSYRPDVDTFIGEIERLLPDPPLAS